MAKRTRDELLSLVVCGRSLEEWDAVWEEVRGGFAADHSQLVDVPGLARALLDGEVKYILRATEKRGLQKGLQRIRGKPQTGNKGFGAQMIRRHIDVLDLEILRFPASKGSVDCIKTLKSRMIELHQPEWDGARQKRLAALQIGKLGKSR
ncbi:hypothetical protein SKP52_14665 [Sphingopyxis fribergensis]|uniref:Uncharacterized protein n=1 Tax=Sphingopyxis fribergensis TaxID=1515612 RepID=A0A0A7PIJ1_9SPHN|nr:hypothetical protein SKP52_14665 [Sphingopyxis fribergensis]